MIGICMFPTRSFNKAAMERLLYGKKKNQPSLFSAISVSGNVSRTIECVKEAALCAVI